MSSRYQPILAAILVFALVLPASAGTFTDRDGGKHAWSIDDTHALVWDGKPYIPFGVEFTPRYLSDGATEANWSADEADIGAFKLAGATDLLIKPGKGMTAIPAEAWQRIVDELEKNGLRYGIELDDSPYGPLIGYVVDPSRNREDNIQSPGDIVKPCPDGKVALYVLCDAATGEVNKLGQVVPEAGEVRVSVDWVPAGAQVLLIYPQRAIVQKSSSWGLPDLWSEYDKHRDQIVAYLSQIKFGSGLRFFLDPFTARFGIRGDQEDLLPVSMGFRLEYAAWLSRKYGNVGDLTTAWGVLGYDVKSFVEAARFVPLWNHSRGIAMVYDDSTGKRYRVDASRSVLWQNHQEFRAASVRDYMNGMADVLKRKIADVPVVFTGNDLQPIFQNADVNGFDGLAVPPASAGQDAAQPAARVFSLADNSRRNIWMIARVSAGTSSDVVYQKKEDLFGEINKLRDLGTKGFFLAGTPADAGLGGADLLVWLAEYANVSNNDKQFAGFCPRVLYYPKDYPRTVLKRLANGVWWVPSLTEGRYLDLGTTVEGYVIAGTGGMELYVWSPKGKRTVTLVASGSVTVKPLSGSENTINPKKGRVAVTLSDEPILLQGVPPEQFLPIEIIEEGLKELETVIAAARKKGMDVDVYRRHLEDARLLLSKNDLGTSYDMITVSLRELKLRMRGLDSAPPSSSVPATPGTGAKT